MPEKKSANDAPTTLKQRVETSPTVFFLAALLAGFLAGIGTYRAILQIAQLETISKKTLADLKSDAASNTDYSSYPIVFTRVPEATQSASLLRQIGFEVTLIKDVAAPNATPEETAANKEKFSAVAVGGEVPARIAVVAIRIARDHMPWLKYVFLQTAPGSTRQLFLNAHESWATTLNLKPLSDADFKAITDEHLSTEQFRRVVQTFQQ